MCNLISSTRIEYLKVLIANARILPDKRNDAFEGMLDDTDGLLSGKSKAATNQKIRIRRVPTKTISSYLPFKWLKTLEAVIKKHRN